MVAKAYVLVETNMGKTLDVVGAIRRVEGVRSVYSVTGPYDIIAVVEGKDLNALGGIITSEFHTIDGISRTVTCLSVEST